MLIVVLAIIGVVSGVGVVVALNHGDLDSVGVPSTAGLMVAGFLLFMSLLVWTDNRSQPVAFQARYDTLHEAIENKEQLINAATRLAVIEFNRDLAVYSFWKGNFWVGIYLPPVPTGVTAIKG